MCKTYLTLGGGGGGGFPKHYLSSISLCLRKQTETLGVGESLIDIQQLLNDQDTFTDHLELIRCISFIA